MLKIFNVVLNYPILMEGQVQIIANSADDARAILENQYRDKPGMRIINIACYSDVEQASLPPQDRSQSEEVKDLLTKLIENKKE